MGAMGRGEGKGKWAVAGRGCSCFDGSWWGRMRGEVMECATVL